jgi:hypothetical protein
LDHAGLRSGGSSPVLQGDIPAWQTQEKADREAESAGDEKAGREEELHRRKEEPSTHIAGTVDDARDERKRSVVQSEGLVTTDDESFGSQVASGVDQIWLAAGSALTAGVGYGFYWFFTQG